MRWYGMRIRTSGLRRSIARWSYSHRWSFSKKLDFGDGRSRYELNDRSLNHSHDHLICLGCGKVIEFSHELFLSDVKDKIQKESGFHVVDYQLKFYGYCKNCVKKE